MEQRTYYDLPDIQAGGLAGSAGIARGLYGPVFREYFAYLADFTGNSALAAGTLNGLPSVQAFTDLPSGVQIQPDSDFELCALTYTATDARVYARFRDNASGRYLQIGTLDLRDVCAQAAQGPSVGGAGAASAQSWIPYVLPMPYTFGAMSIIGVSLADFSGATNTVRLALHGHKVYTGVAPWMVAATESDDRQTHALATVMQYLARIAGAGGPLPDPATFSAIQAWLAEARTRVRPVAPASPRPYKSAMPFIVPIPSIDSTSSSISASASLTVTSQMDVDSDFLVEQIVGQRIGAATVDLADNSAHGQSQRSGITDHWTSAPIHVDNLCGNGIFPHALSAPRFLQAGSVITATLADISAAANNVRLYLVGRKLFF